MPVVGEVIQFSYLAWHLVGLLNEMKLITDEYN